jgi:sulfate/thiosulfate transport system permease protein
MTAAPFPIPPSTARDIAPPARRRRIIPGFGLSLGYTLTYLSLLVLIPLGALFLKTAKLSWSEFWRTITDPFVMSALKLSFGASLIAGLINGVFGLLVAWVLVRYPFPGRRFFDALIDFPFALPTAVAGLTFSNLYSSDGWIGRWNLFGLKLNFANSNVGIVIVLVFVGVPFIVRTVQPVLQELDRDIEEAAGSLGATRLYTFRRVILPELLPAWLAGFALAFARAIGEYGSVIFIAGNIPGKSQIAPLQIVTQLDDFRYSQATAIAVVLLITSLAMLLLINGLEWWSKRKER